MKVAPHAEGEGDELAAASTASGAKHAVAMAGQARHRRDRLVLQGSEHLHDVHQQADGGRNQQQRGREKKRDFEACCEAARWSGRFPYKFSGKAPHQRTDEQVPSIDHHEQKNLQRGGDNDRWQLQHADRSGDRGGHHVDDQERQKKGRADAEARLEFGEQIGGGDNAHIEIVGPRGPRRVRQSDKQLQVFFARILQHEMAHWDGGARQCGHRR